MRRREPASQERSPPLFPLHTYLVALAILYVPGCIVWARWLKSPLAIFAAGPGTSIFLYVVAGIVLSKMHVRAGAFEIALFSLIAGTISFLASLTLRKRHETSPDTSSQLKLFALCLVIGFVFSYWFFSHSLSGWSSIIQSEDNIRHYTFIQNLLNSTDWSTLDVSMYGMGSSQILGPNVASDGVVYPLGWHIVSALTCALSPTDVGTGSNIANLAFTSATLPVGTCSLLSFIFPEHPKKRLALGSAATLLFPATSWVLLGVWPLFPNLASMCLVPASAALFIGAFKERDENQRLPLGIAFVLACGGIGATQTNGLFSCAVFLAPFAVATACDIAFSHSKKGHGSEKKARLIAGAVTSLAIAAAWLLAYRLPVFNAVVSTYWAPLSSTWQVIVDVALVAYPLQAVSPVLAVLVLVGLTSIARHSNNTWLIAAYLFGALLFVVSAGFGNNILKHILTGFWYTDPYRVAGVASLCSTPLAYVGICATLDFAESRCSVMRRNPSQSSWESLAPTFVAIVSLFIIFALPSFQVRGLLDVTTPFTDMTSHMRGFTRQEEGSILTREKIDFISQVRSVVDETDVIANIPYDGSCYAESVANLNLLFKNDEPYTDDFTAGWAIAIKNELANISHSDEIARIASEHSVRYVLLLGEDADTMGSWKGSFREQDWLGLSSISDETPGFKTVLSQGDMRLYEITDNSIG